MLNSAIQHERFDRVFLEDVTSGLSLPQKSLPCKYFYDADGVALFDEICELEEYYVTRTELALLKQHAGDMANHIGKEAAIIEPGAGAGQKIQILLDALESPALYVPLDISQTYLDYSQSVIRRRFPGLTTHTICADFTRTLHWPRNLHHDNRVVFFPGSTLGNLSPQEAREFLRNLKRLVGNTGLLLVGIDMLKPVSILVNAYNDAKGVTARFNKNILRRINRELGANFELENFAHNAVFNEQLSRIEMHLRCIRPCRVSIGHHQFTFAADETIHTENSYKYSEPRFNQLATSADLKISACWQDENEYLGLFLLH